MVEHPHDILLATREESCCARGLKHFRGFVLFLTAIAALILVGMYLAQGQIDPMIERMCECKLNQLLAKQGVQMRLGGARFIDGQGVLLSDVEITQPAAEQPLIATANRVFLHAPLSKVDLVEGKFKPERITVSGLRMHARKEASGWNLQRLLVQNDKPLEPVPIAIEDSALLIFADAQSEIPVTGIRDLHLNIQPGEGARAGTLAFSLSCDGRDCGPVQLRGGFDRTSGKWGVAGKADGLRFDPAILQRLPADLSKQLDALKAVSGQVSCGFSVGGTGLDGVPQFQLDGSLAHGRVADPHLPFPLTEIKADFSICNSHIDVSNIKAETTVGEVDLTFKKDGLLNPDGTMHPAPIVLTASMQRLFLNERLAVNAPEELRSEWRKFQPSGPVNIDATLTFDGRKLQHDVTVDLLDVAITYYKTPYRLEGCRGRIHCVGNRCKVDVDALAAGATVHFDGDYTDPGPNMTGVLKFHSEGNIPVDEKLIAATRRNQSLYKTLRQFRPTGMINGSGSITRTRGVDGRIVEDKDYTVQLSEGTVVYDLFPYPFNGITGSIHVKNDVIEYRNINGHNDGGRAVCNGQLDPRNGLSLTFNLSAIDLEEELKNALSTDLQNVWESIRPRGSIDYAQVVLNKPPQQELQLNMTLRKFPEQEGTQRDPLSVFPVWFPYRTNDIAGTVFWNNGVLTVERLSGHHGDTRISVAGGGRFDRDDWRIVLNEVNFDRLSVESDFVSALPPQLASAVETLDVKGMLNIGGSLEISDRNRPASAAVAQVAYLSAEQNGPTVQPTNISTPTFKWDLRVDMADGSIQTGLPLTNIYGGARFIGTSTADDFYSSGRIEADSMLCNGLPVTRLSGPIWVDSTRIGLGGWAEPVKVETDRQMMTANFFGGKLIFDGMVALSDNMPFQIQTRVDRSDLRDFIQEVSPTTENVSGLAYAALTLTGDSRGAHTYQGSGSVRLKSAKISEVPVMLAMLKLLSVKQFDRTAFNEGNMDFTIEGRHCYFNRLEFLGDAISLKGNGELSFDQDIKLNFYTGVGKDSFRIPVISPLFGAASQRVLLVQVDGSLGEPDVSKRLFPHLDERLKEMFPELEQDIRTAAQAGSKQR